MGTIGDLLSGAAGQIGRYFSVLTVIPSGALVTYVYLLVASGAWDGSPDWGTAAASLGSLSLAAIFELSLVTLLVGVVLHPLQYASTQALEGYWGVSRLATQAMARRTRHHRRRYSDLHTLRAWGAHAYDVRRRDGDTARPVPDWLLSELVTEREASRLLGQYPDHLDHILPTRLGNVLRRYETRAGRQYGLLAVTTVPRLAHVAPPAQVAYVSAQRTELDLAVRMVVISGLATCASALFLWRCGLWLLLALVPYALMYASYRGAVVAAGGYGAAVSTLIDLNRFALYDRLGVPRPGGTTSERRQNERLMKLLRGNRNVDVVYAPAPEREELAP